MLSRLAAALVGLAVLGTTGVLGIGAVVCDMEPGVEHCCCAQMAEHAVAPPKPSEVTAPPCCTMRPASRSLPESTTSQAPESALAATAAPATMLAVLPRTPAAGSIPAAAPPPRGVGPPIYLSVQSFLI